MDFAKKLLSKYGWKEGEGLGKNNDGIAKPLKASLKFDSAGFGTDKAKEFNNHWWERVFNEAADNVKVGKDGDKVTMNVKDNNSVEISTKEYSVRKLKKINSNDETYGNFLKHATLTSRGNEEENEKKVNVEDIAVTSYKPLTDEELFAACGGRTAHKGARHGLNLTGKLSRIEEQEKELLAKMQSSLAKNQETEKAWTVVNGKKKKKSKKENKSEIPYNSDLTDDLIYNAEYCIKSKKNKKKRNKVEKDLSECMESFSIDNSEKKEKENLLSISETSKSIKKSKNKKKKREIEIDPLVTQEDECLSLETPLENLDDSFTITKKKKSKSKEVLISGSIGKKSKKDKKIEKKLKKLVASVTDDFENVALAV